MESHIKAITLQVLLLTISRLFQTLIISTNHLPAYFTVRSRALASFLTAIVGIAANLTTGALLDLPAFTRPRKSRSLYLLLLIAITACWIWTCIVQIRLSSDPSPPSFDLGTGAFFNSAFAGTFPLLSLSLSLSLPSLHAPPNHSSRSQILRLVYMLFKFFYEVLQTYIYWLMAEIKGAQREGDISRTTGILRSWESVGSTIAYAVGATHWSNQNQMILGFALWLFTVPWTLLAVFGDWDVDETRSELGLKESDLEVQIVSRDIVVSGKS